MHRGDGLLRGHGHHRAEVARGLAVDQVAPAVAALGLDQRHVAVDRVLEHVLLAVDLAGFAVARELGAVARGAEEGADAGTGRADALGQVALRHQLELELAAAVERVEDVAVGLARKAADDLAHAAGLEQRGEAGVAVAGVVVDHRQVARALLDEAVDEFAGNAGGAEAADENGGAVGHAREGVGDGGRDLVDHGSVSEEGWCRGGKTVVAARLWEIYFVRISNICSYNEF